MSSGFDELTRQARDLVVAGDLAGAQELLGEALVAADPSPETASPDLTEAAGLQARVLLTLGEPHAARGWAAFGYSAATRLFGPSDQRTIAAAATLAAVLHRVGNHSRAALLYRDVVIELTAIDGPESLRVLAAHADLATVEYARGECVLARNRLADAWELHREVYGAGHTSGIKMLARLGAMERDCGRFGEAHEHLALARELCREHLPADHPLAAQITALSKAPANPDHVCADVSGAAAEAPPEPEAPAYPGAPEPPYQAAEPDAPPYRDAPTGPYPEAEADAPPYAAAGPAAPYHPYPPSQAAYPTVPPQRSPAEQQPSSGDSYWSRPDGIATPYEDPSAPPAVPPSVPPAGGLVWRPGQPAGAEPAGLPALRQPADRRLPAVYHPPRRSARRMLPIVLAGLVVVLLGAGAVIAGFALVEDSAPTPGRSTSATPPATTGPSTAAQPPQAPPGSPPTGVTLRDNRQSVTLSWTYPAGAEGPVVVAGGRSGQEPRAFQELPAGSSSFTVYGLNNSLDYCFTVAVVYSTDKIGRSKAVCTGRATRSPGR